VNKQTLETGYMSI